MTVYNVSGIVDATLQAASAEQAIVLFRALVPEYDATELTTLVVTDGDPGLWYVQGQISALFGAKSSFGAIRQMRATLTTHVGFKAPMAFPSEDVPREWVR